MRLRSVKLERQIREAARHELRSSKASWKEYKRMKKAGRRSTSQRTVAIFFVVMGPIYLLFVADFAHMRGLAFLALALAIYSTGTVFMRAWSFESKLRRSGELSVFLTLPVEDERIFDHLWHQTLWGSTFVIYAAVVAYGYWAYTRMQSNHAWAWLVAASLAALLQWTVVVAPMLMIVKLEAKWPLTWIGLAIEALILVLFFAPAGVTKMAESAVVPLPGGWVPEFFQGAFLIGNRGSFWFLIPIAILASTIPITSKFLRKRYRIPLESALMFEDRGAFGEADVGTQPTEAAELEGDRESARMEFEPLIAAEHLKRGEFLQELDWSSSGWLERIAKRWLRPSEKLTAEFMMSEEIGGWSARWKTAAKLSAVGIVLTVMLPPSAAYEWILFVPLIIAGMTAAPFFGGYWPGFGLRFCGGRLAPAYAAYPVDYRGISLTMFKVNGARLLGWLPLLLLYAYALAWRMNAGPLFGFTIGLKTLWAVVALQPVMVFGHFSKRTNDTDVSGLGWLTRAIPSLIAMVGGALAVAFLIAAGFVLKPLLAVASLCAASAVAVGMWALYGYLYNSGRIDLLRNRE